MYAYLLTAAGHTYWIKITYGVTCKVAVYFKYDPLIISVTQNVHVCGACVAQAGSFLLFHNDYFGEINCTKQRKACLGD